ncbi:MAG: hypothetical protein A2Y17_01995 [Clostridiales bacterium GWF2_38_85]|nr:MAG: hypothetical protein A2Y17_01995 [Clostridiales bacterium GWF2_38_85]HBL85330.1 hypothetical protein [Clostridiales bacterium]
MSKLHPNAQKQLVYFLGNDLEVICSEEKSNEYIEILKNKGKLPPNIRQSSEDLNRFYKMAPEEYTTEDLQALLQLQHTQYTRTIKNCLVFITTLVVISLVISLLGLLSAM